jgi:signal transduction histidine kinase
LSEQLASDERELAIATMEPTLRQRRLALAIIGMLSIGFVAIAPFAAKQVVQIASFVPTTEAIIFVTSLTTAVLLFSQFSILGSRELLLLASGYLFAALIVIPHALSYPGAFAPKGLLGSGIQATPWLYTFWHFGFSAAVLGYACLLDTNSNKLFIHNSGMPAICLSTGIVVALVCALTWSVVANEQYWPRLLANEVDFTRLTNYVAAIPLVTSVLAFIVLWIRRRSVLDLWLAVAIFATVVEQSVSCLFIFNRYSVGAYAVRTFSMIVSTIVLSAMLSETVQLYARLASAIVLLRRERRTKLMSAQAITAAIAHEMRQPLTRITAGGGAAQRFLEMVPPQYDKAKTALAGIVNAGHNTSKIIDGFRSLFNKPDEEQELVDMNELIPEVLKSLHSQLDHRVSIRVDLTPKLPAVAGNRIQLQEVVSNLITNSMEAMETTTVQIRRLLIRTEIRGDNVAVAVEDSGPGIDKDQLEDIFTAFVTTKRHGTGLGLAICRMIIEYHGGKLTAASDSTNGGASFQFVLPVADLR